MPSPRGPPRHLDVSRQKLSPHCLETIFDSQLPSPKSSPKMPPKLSLPDKRGYFFASFKITPAVRVIARQLRDKHCLAAIFTPRHQYVSSGPLGVPAFYTIVPLFVPLFRCWGFVVPFFVLSFRFWGSGEHPPKPPFWKPPFCEPLNFPQNSRHISHHELPAKNQENITDERLKDVQGQERSQVNKRVKLRTIVKSLWQLQPSEAKSQPINRPKCLLVISLRSRTKKGHKHKEGQKPSLLDPLPQGPPDPANSLCLGPLLPSKQRKRPT